MAASSSNAASTGPPPALIARLNEKKSELEHLKELRDLSGVMAKQMEALEEKLATLSDGTEGSLKHRTVARLFSFILTNSRQPLRW
jgi:hypothetical protein